MRPQPFAALLAEWLTAADHPGIARVQTCAQVGRHEQPAGVAVTLSDGWGFVLQAVRSSPRSGDTDTPGEHGWDPAAYRTARHAADQAAATVTAAARGSRPQARAAVLVEVCRAAVAQAAHPAVTAVEVAPAASGPGIVLRVTMADGSTIHGLPVGFIRPGSTGYTAAAHHVPGECL